MADSAMVSAIFVHKKIENFNPRFLSETFFTVPFYCYSQQGGQNATILPP